MNFLQAQNTHVMWKAHLERYLLEPDQKNSNFNTETAGDKTLCDLGIWLEDKKDILGQSEHYQTVQILHDEFHALVAQVIKSIKNDDTEKATSLMKGRYKEVSHQLKITLSKMAKEFDYKI